MLHLFITHHSFENILLMHLVYQTFEVQNTTLEKKTFLKNSDLCSQSSGVIYGGLQHIIISANHIMCKIYDSSPSMDLKVV